MFDFLELGEPELGYYPDVKGDLLYMLMWIGIIFVMDKALIMLNWFPEKKSATRYFSLHVIVNAFVVYVHLPDVIAVYTDPVNAWLGPIETRGVMAIYALHFYHMLFFRPLAMVDWVGICLVLQAYWVLMPWPGSSYRHGCYHASLGLPFGARSHAWTWCVLCKWIAR